MERPVFGTLIERIFMIFGQIQLTAKARKHEKYKRGSFAPFKLVGLGWVLGSDVAMR